MELSNSLNQPTERRFAVHYTGAGDIEFLGAHGIFDVWVTFLDSRAEYLILTWSHDQRTIKLRHAADKYRIHTIERDNMNHRSLAAVDAALEILNANFDYSGDALQRLGVS